MIFRWLSTASVLCGWLQVTHALTCFQQDDPRNPLSKVQINCSPTTDAVALGARSTIQQRRDVPVSSTNLTFQGLRSPVSTILAEATLPAPSLNVNYTNMFVFSLICPSQISMATCEKVNQTMYHAGQLVSNVLDLTSTISVNVTLSSFCDSLSLCAGNSDITSLAAAAPARTIPLIDDDGITRLYPQAVVKQFSSLLSVIPQFSTYDVNLNVNSDGAFYYPDTGYKITSSQSDFLFVMLHELMHGIGFTSSYEDYFHTTTASTVTPNVLLSYTADEVVFEGFIESAFDRNFVFSGGQVVTDLVQGMNVRVTGATETTTFNDTEALTSFILDQSDFQTLSQSLTKNFTTANTTTFLVPVANASTSLMLETAIDPFSSGSSVSHLAADVYAGTGDFLMRAYCAKGVTLVQSIEEAKSRGAVGTELYGALGPGLRSVLGTLGYRVRGGIPGQAQIMTAASMALATESTTATSSGTQFVMSLSCLAMAVFLHCSVF